MYETAVADRGPPPHLAEVGQESNLTVFDGVTVSEQVKEELTRRGALGRTEAALGGRLAVASVTQTEMDAQEVALSGFRAHQADLSVAALAARLLPNLVLTDDLELRKGLESQGHTVVGSVGVLARAFKVGRFTKVDLRSYLDQLFDGSTLYLSTAFRAYVRKLLNTLPE